MADDPIPTPLDQLIAAAELAQTFIAAVEWPSWATEAEAGDLLHAIDQAVQRVDDLAAVLRVPLPDRLLTLAADPTLREPGWDSYRAAPVTDAAVAAARKFLDYPWSAVPCADGGVQLERHDGESDIELTWDATGTLIDAHASAAA